MKFVKIAGCSRLNKGQKKYDKGVANFILPTIL